MVSKNELSKKFIELLEVNIGIIIKISSAYSKSREDREDLYHDIVLQLWKSFESFKGQSKISTWIYRVTLNTAMSYHFRKERELVIFTDKFLEPRFRNMITNNDLDLEKYSILYKCIEELDETNKAIVLLYLDNNTHEEISQIMGISVTNVGTRISRIKEQLKNTAVKKL